MNIRNAADRATIEAKGYSFVTVCPRGEHKGQVVSKHRSYDAANKAARNCDIAIVGMDSAQYY